MTTSERDALTRKLLAERQQVAGDIKMLTAELQRVGDTLIRLGNALNRNPAGVFFEGQSSFFEFKGDGAELFPVSSIAGEVLAKTTESLRERTARLKKVHDGLF